MNKNINIKDVARISKVGVSTVSRVLNNQRDVKPETREKVLKVISDYNYIPNNSARNLKRNSSKNIGVLVKGIYNPFFSKMIQDIQDGIKREGFSMILHYSDGRADDVDTVISLIKEKKLKGLICLGGNFENFSDGQIIELDTPIVLCSANTNINLNRDLFSSISIDNRNAAKEAVEFMISMGHRKIGLISTYEGDDSVCRFRIDGYRDALKIHGIEYINEYVEMGEYTFESGFSAMNRLLDKKLDITAVFIISDIMAIGGAKAALKRGYKLPDDISIMGFDGIDFAEYFQPSITTISQPSEKMAAMSTEVLFNIIIKNGFNRHNVLTTQILIRESLKKLEGSC